MRLTVLSLRLLVWAQLTRLRLESVEVGLWFTGMQMASQKASTLERRRQRLLQERCTMESHCWLRSVVWHLEYQVRLMDSGKHMSCMESFRGRIYGNLQSSFP